MSTDAVVVGAGPNGLVAANLLADAGWDVTVLEAQPEPGGAVRSGELIEPGFVHDLFSAFYPLAAAHGPRPPRRPGLAMGRIPARPPMIVGQMTTTDPSRSPAVTETAWAYTQLHQQLVFRPVPGLRAASVRRLTGPQRSSRDGPS